MHNYWQLTLTSHCRTVDGSVFTIVLKNYYMYMNSQIFWSSGCQSWLDLISYLCMMIIQQSLWVPLYLNQVCLYKCQISSSINHSGVCFPQLWYISYTPWLLGVHGEYMILTPHSIFDHVRKISALASPCLGLISYIDKREKTFFLLAVKLTEGFCMHACKCTVM